MKLILIADTHEMHDQVTIPPCDVLVHAGDLTLQGRYSPTQRAAQWLDKQPAKCVVMIAGNHDWLFENHAGAAREIISQTRIIYLENSGIEIDGVKFWGSPYTPRFMDWAFNYDRGDIQRYWDLIPADTNVLITHGPPLGVLDQCAPHLHSEHLGCYDLDRTVRRLSPEIHVFGHIHGGYGAFSDVTNYYNASVVNEAYKVVHKPFEVEL